MTISVLYSPDVYAGDGTTTNFPITFQYLNNAVNLSVAIKDNITGNYVVAVPNTDYTVINNEIVFESGSIPSSDETVIIELSIPKTQEVDLQQNTPFSAEVIESALDKLTLLVQRITDIERRVALFDAALTGSFNNIIPSPVANQFLRVNSTGDAWLLSNGSSVMDMLSVADGNFYVGDGSSIVAESGATARSSMGLGSIATQNANAVSITGGGISGIVDLAIADGGTGASTDSGARTNLGLEIGTDVLAYDADLAASNIPVTKGGTGAGTFTSGSVITGNGTSALQAAANVAIVSGTLTISNADTSAGQINFLEDSDNGTSKVTLKAADSLASDSVVTLPSATTLLVGTDTTDTLTNKSLDYTANTITKLPYDISFLAGYDSDGVKEDLAEQVYAKLVMPRAGTILGESAALETAATGDDLIFDIKKNGTSVYSALPEFAASSTTLTPGTVKSDGTEDFVAGDVLTFEVTQIGSSTEGQGLTVTIKGEC